MSFGHCCARFVVDDEVDVALPVQRHVLAAVPRDHREAHALEQVAQQVRIGRGVFDELEAVRAHRVVEEVCHGDSPADRCNCNGF